ARQLRRGEVCCAAALGLLFGDLEVDGVLTARVTVTGQPLGIVQFLRVLRVLRTLTVHLLPGAVEVHRDRFAHIGHHRIVDQFGGVQLVVQPAPGDPLPSASRRSISSAVLSRAGADWAGPCCGSACAEAFSVACPGVCPYLMRASSILSRRRFSSHFWTPLNQLPAIPAMGKISHQNCQMWSTPPAYWPRARAWSLSSARARRALRSWSLARAWPSEGPRRRSGAPRPPSPHPHCYETHRPDRHATPAVVPPRTALSPRHEEAPGCHIRQLSPR